MARPIKQGIEYFSFDVNFICDIKVQKIKKACGPISLAILPALLCNIHKDYGYYILWDSGASVLIADDIGVKDGTVRETVIKAVQVGFFDQGLYGLRSILTSREIQERFWAGTEKRKRVVIYEEFCLLDDEKSRRSNILLQKYETAQISDRVFGVNLPPETNDDDDDDIYNIYTNHPPHLSGHQGPGQNQSGTPLKLDAPLTAKMPLNKNTQSKTPSNTPTNIMAVKKASNHQKDIYEYYKEIILKNVEYDDYINLFNYRDDGGESFKKLFNLLIKIMIETVSSKTKKILISGEYYPIELVRKKFLEIKGDHLVHACNCMNKHIYEIEHPKPYMLTVLFNLPEDYKNQILFEELEPMSFGKGLYD